MHTNNRKTDLQLGDETRNSRKKWSDDASAIESKPVKILSCDKVRVAQQLDPPTGYDEYLLLLQQRNELLTKVKLKDKKHIEMQRKESGFALYVNGANNMAGGNHHHRESPTLRNKLSITHRLRADIDKLEDQVKGGKSVRNAARSRTAPEACKKTERKNWVASSINIQTAKGSTMHLQAPVDVTGNYSEDFEDLTVIDKQAEAESDTDESTSDVEDFVTEAEEGNQLLLTLEDVTKLRCSLELNESIRESLANLTENSDSGDEIVEESCSSLADGATVVLEFARGSKMGKDIEPDLTPSPKPLTATPQSVEQKSAESYLKKRVKNPLVNSFMQNADLTIKQAEDRVVELEPQQQKSLIKTLYQVEQAIRPSSGVPCCSGNNSAYKIKDTEIHKVTLEFLSNWGHQTFVGLTEILLLNEKKEKLTVNPASLRLNGAVLIHGEPANLFNGRFKTTKERNMFCCKQSEERPVSLSFRVELKLGSQIHLVKLWNYNRSLHDLNIGVRQLRLSIDNDILFDGEIDKGCGNQVFDYGHSIVVGYQPDDDEVDISFSKTGQGEKKKPEGMWIPLANSRVTSDRCETRILMRSTEGISLPVIQAIEPQSINSDLTHGTIQERENYSGEETLQGTTVETRVLLSKKMAAQLNLGAASDVMMSSQEISLDKTKLLENQVDNAVPPWVMPLKTDLRSSFDKMLDSLDHWRPTSQSADLPTIFDGNVKETPAGPEGKPKYTVSEAMNAVEMNDGRSILGNTEETKQSAQRRKRWQRNSDLEASWSSLDLFEKSHRGRLSVEGDSLDEYIDDTRRKDCLQTLDTVSEEQSELFTIPELPKGNTLTFNIKSTWGDKYYVGLNGIEIFCDTGEPATVSKIISDPRDINVLSDYQDDPRVVTNLIDGHNKTRDDTHMWLAPYTPGGNHFIHITFAAPTTIALVRIWNYNKSRIHSFRGARDLDMSLDGRYIFKGEIQRACGGTQGGTEAFGDTILFTTRDCILDAVSRHDGQYDGGNLPDGWEDDVPVGNRPTTADTGDERPFTSVERTSIGTYHKQPTVNRSTDIQTDLVRTALPVGMHGDSLIYSAKDIVLNFTETWGDPHYIGLTGFEIVIKDGTTLPIDLNMLEANPRDLHVLPGYESDDRTLDKLIDGINISTSDEHMWLVPYTEGASHTIEIAFPVVAEIIGLRIWNYNKSPEDTYRGAKTMHAFLDGNRISPPQGFLLRKGPGSCHYDFAQELLFSEVLRAVQKDSQQPYLFSHPADIEDSSFASDMVEGRDESFMPRGFVYQFQLISTHGDAYYIGLDSVEFYDAVGKRIALDESNVAAYPDSVNVLEGISGDVRTPDKLIANQHDTTGNEHSWLAPVLPNVINRMFIIFDYPQSVSRIRIWNYSKSPHRGVKEFALLVDDLLVYNGSLSGARNGGILPGIDAPLEGNTIWLTSDKTIRQNLNHIGRPSTEQQITLTNDSKIVLKSSRCASQIPVDQALRPRTRVGNRVARPQK